MTDRQEAMMAMYFNIVMIMLTDNYAQMTFIGTSLICFIVFVCEIRIEKNREKVKEQL